MLERLKNVEVPPPPEDIDLQVHLQLNRLLSISHFIEFGMRVMPLAVTHVVVAMVAVFTFSLTGQYDLTKQKGKYHE
jgi:hypothetical protein